jgi:RNA polymerase sigma factor (sigma-70 family)
MAPQNGARADKAPAVNPASPATSPPAAPDPPLDTEQAFRRLVARVTPCARRWLVWWRVPQADRDDVLQQILIAMYKRRSSFDPARGRYEAWAYGFAGLVILNHRKRAKRRSRVEALAPEPLPEVASPTPTPEEKVAHEMMRRLLYKCLDSLEGDLVAILLARDVDGTDMETIAAAHGISLSTAYAHYKRARADLQAALDREQAKTRALGVALLPIALDQLIASDGGLGNAPAATLRSMWKTLERLMDEDRATGALGDEAPSAPPATGAARGLRPRALRAILGPRGLPALTFTVGTAAGAAAMHLVDHARGSRPDSAESSVRAQGAGAPALSVLAPDPVTDGTLTLGAQRAGTSAAAEPRADAGAERGGAADRDALARDQGLFDQGATAFQAGYYPEAVKALRDHATRYPASQYATARERLLTLALIHADQKGEARQRIERLRRTNPRSPLLREFDAALPPERQP